MMTFEEALRTILGCTQTLSIQRLRLESLLGSVLAKSVVAPFHLPLFNNSAVDGFGVRVQDIQGASQEEPITLPLRGTVQAGDTGRINLQSGTTLKILTGAPIPIGVEAVVMKEFCDEGEDSVTFQTSTQPLENIRKRGEEFKKGATVLPPGMVVTPPVIGLLATLGYSSFPVFRKPSVGLISTGNELIKPGTPLNAGQIYDSNTYALTAALKTITITKINTYYAKDTLSATQRAFQKALAENDVIISLGGISVGDYDYVKDVAETLGVRTLFWKISIKPGKPVYFGIYQKGQRQKWVFGLPGNPVSALVTFHQLVQPALLKMMGYALLPEEIPYTAVLTQDIKKKPGRMEFVRGILKRQNGIFTVSPTRGQDSHMLSGLAHANCLIHFASEEATLRQGERVSITPLRWAELPVCTN
jgi:molybdopterin molybdotransferase